MAWSGVLLVFLLLGIPNLKAQVHSGSDAGQEPLTILESQKEACEQTVDVTDGKGQRIRVKWFWGLDLNSGKHYAVPATLIVGCFEPWLELKRKEVKMLQGLAKRVSKRQQEADHERLDKSK